MTKAMQIIISKPARHDIRDIFFFIAVKNNRDVAHEQIVKIHKCIERLGSSPDIGAHVMHKFQINTDLRYLVSGKYIIVYRIDNTMVRVLRVIDGRRDWARVLFL